MSNIQLHSNENFSVRTTQDENGQVWFVGKDIAQALEYSEESNPARLFASVPKCWKGVKRIHTVERGIQDMICLTEQGVYFFLGRSDKPKALPYQMWIAGEVVPSIMHTGSYTIRENSPAITRQELETIDYFLERAGIKGNQATLTLDKYIKSCTGRSVLEIGKIELIAPTQNQHLTPTDIGNMFGLKAQRVNEILAGAGYQCKVGDKWQPLELGEPYAVMQDTNKRHSDGTPVRQLKWDASILPIFEELMR